MDVLSEQAMLIEDRLGNSLVVLNRISDEEFPGIDVWREKLMAALEATRLAESLVHRGA